ncbi:emb [Venturia nashicola]|uniref:Adenine DNA glycosylase n=1 Tax=Venturia nashicola TaxID=86259 RepID=A0A4Z1NYA0_9PEZI|nr:emb [Venturia nashicola]
MTANKRPRTKSLTLNQAPPKRVKKQQDTFSFLSADSQISLQPALPPLRQHKADYHRPALLDHVPTQKSLLTWFDTVSKDRDMPWRQKWINPSTFCKAENSDLNLRETLKRRAYQVWISEIMLQQTRVETVRAYYTSWHARWPTIEDLAKAEEAEVLNAWKGLGYYSRATRIHKAAKLIVDDSTMNGMLPELPSELEAKVPGVGRYTAGAVSSIVFGHAVPILDGNVMRVLCRQTGLYANMKSKVTTDLLWEVAEKLVKRVTREALSEKGVKMEDEEVSKSEIPSFWNQALMELGSTLCKPVKPDCGNCPVRDTCLAYAEGEKLAVEKGLLNEKSSSSVFDTTAKVQIPDIEDLCSYCEPVEEIEVMDEPEITSSKRSTKAKPESRQKSKLKQGTLAFGQKSKPASEATESKTNLTSKRKDLIEKHVSLFPLKVIKKAVRNEEHNVCIISRKSASGEDEYLIEQRPDKGLLASLWQFPSLTIFNDEGQATNASEEDSASELDDSDGLPVTLLKKKLKKKKNVHKGKTMIPPLEPPDAKKRKHSAITFVNFVLSKTYEPHRDDEGLGNATHISEIGSLRHLFSHIRLVMHVHTFMFGLATPKEISLGLGVGKEVYQKRKWVSREEIEGESFGTGMRKCWMLYLEGVGMA